MNAQKLEGKALEYVLVAPKGVAAPFGLALVVLLHGFGASMYDLANLAPSIDQESYVYAFPNAPYKVDLGGASGYSWSLGRPGVEAPKEDGPSVDEMLETFMGDVIEVTGAERGKMLLGGFSQGAGVALRYALPRPETFRGIAVLSGFFRDADTVKPLLPAKREQRIFIAHGRRDPMISLEQAQATKSFLEGEGYKPEYHEYNMAHEITPEVMRDLVPWLRATLA